MPGSGAQPTLKAGNAPVAPLVLHEALGGGDRLTSRSFALSFPIKKS